MKSLLFRVSPRVMAPLDISAGIRSLVGSLFASFHFSFLTDCLLFFAIVH
jgi:hypothetical protein